MQKRSLVFILFHGVCAAICAQTLTMSTPVFNINPDTLYNIYFLWNK